MNVSTKQVTVNGQIYDVILHESDDGDWYGEATQPPFGKEMNVRERGTSEAEVLGKIKKALESGCVPNSTAVRSN